MIEIQEIIASKIIIAHGQIIEMDTALLDLEETWLERPEIVVSFGETIVGNPHVVDIRSIKNGNLKAFIRIEPLGSWRKRQEIDI